MGGTLIALGLGSVFFIPSLGFIAYGWRKAGKQDYLRQNGMAVEANFQSVECNHRVLVNGRHPFRVVCNWRNPATQQVHRLESERIWYDPSDYINVSKVRVFVDKQNPRKYYMDISFLPHLAD